MINWQEQWMQQSKAFFDAAQKNFKDGFSENAFTKPEENLDQINQWLDALKKQWSLDMFPDSQKGYPEYWQTITKMYSDAADIMIAQWMKRAREENPINNSKELYELWLTSCHEVYQKTVQTEAYQKAYAEFLKGATNFWKGTLQK